MGTGATGSGVRGAGAVHAARISCICAFVGSFREKRASKKEDSEGIFWGMSRRTTMRSAVSSVAMISFSLILRSVRTTEKNTSKPSMKNRSRTLR